MSRHRSGTERKGVVDGDLAHRTCDRGGVDNVSVAAAAEGE